MKLGFDTPGTSMKCDYTLKVVHLCVLAKKEEHPEETDQAFVCVLNTLTHKLIPIKFSIRSLNMICPCFLCRDENTNTYLLSFNKTSLYWFLKLETT